MGRAVVGFGGFFPLGAVAVGHGRGRRRDFVIAQRGRGGRRPTMMTFYIGARQWFWLGPPVAVIGSGRVGRRSVRRQNLNFECYRPSKAARRHTKNLFPQRFF